MCLVTLVGETIVDVTSVSTDVSDAMTRRFQLAAVIMFAAAGLCLVAMAIFLVIDWFTVKAHPAWSMPYSGYVVGLMVLFLPMAVVLALLGWVFRRRASRVGVDSG